MATTTEPEDDIKKLVSSFLGVSFAVFLAYLPEDATTLVPQLQSEIGELHRQLLLADEQLRQMKSRRKEDSKANARVVEIFAGHRNAWRTEEKRLVEQIDAATQEMVSLTARIRDLESENDEYRNRVAELEAEVGEREEMMGFMSRRDLEDDQFNSAATNGMMANKFWAESPNYLYQDAQYESFEPQYETKHFVARRDSPWKVDGESTGVSSKLRSLEQELISLDEVSKGDVSKVPSLLKKQAKRYQGLTGKIDDLCRRMQGSDPCEPTLSPELRTQRQTEFLLEAFRLQHRASETAQKLATLQTDIGKYQSGDDSGGLTMRRSLDLIKNNLKEVQRNLEIWLARIIGDLEGILARDSGSREREYCISRYPFAQ